MTRVTFSECDDEKFRLHRFYPPENENSIEIEHLQIDFKTT